MDSFSGNYRHEYLVFLGNMCYGDGGLEVFVAVNELGQKALKKPGRTWQVDLRKIGCVSNEH
jgi:hypothetical protein